MTTILLASSRRVLSQSTRTPLALLFRETLEKNSLSHFNTQCSVVRVGPGSLPETFEAFPDRLQVDVTSPEHSALMARLNLSFSDPLIMRQVLTHKSFLHATAATNDRLRFLGEKAIELYATEYYQIKFPHLPITTIENVLSIHYGPRALSYLGKSFGMEKMVKFKLDQDEEDKVAGFTTILGKTIQALVGAIYHDKGAKEAKNFIHKYLISRPIDPTELLPLEHPIRTLHSLLKILNKEPLVSRLLKETGRLSNRPIFIVGAFSGTVKLGEGYGSSLKMAEFRACRDAIIRYYMKELKDFNLPSEMEDVDEDSLTFIAPKLENIPSAF